MKRLLIGFAVALAASSSGIAQQRQTSPPLERASEQAFQKSIDDPPGAPSAWLPVAFARSERIAGIDFDESSRRTEAQGSDIWPITWADDGHQYTSFGDGGGFNGSNRVGRVSMGVTRIEGELNEYRGINVWGGAGAKSPATFHGQPARGKGTGILSVDGVLYMWIGRPKLLGETGLAVSHDHGSRWQPVKWHWTIDDRICAGAFVNCGRDHMSAPDEFVYACFTRVVTRPYTDRGWVYERPGQVDLARVQKNQILSKSKWQWFAGLNDDEKPRWTNKIEDRHPTLEDPNGIKIVSVCYQPALRLYLLMYSPRDNAGNFALLEAEHPWGPWQSVTYLKNKPLFTPPTSNGRVSTFHFAPKWWSDDGQRFGLVFNVGDDAWNTVSGRLLIE